MPFVTMGSGAYNAMSVFEQKFRDDLPLEEAKELVIEAVQAGITHDEGSGSNVDICVLMKDKTDYFRNIRIGNNKLYQKKFPY